MSETRRTRQRITDWSGYHQKTGRDFVRTLFEQRTTALVIDADGLNCLAPGPRVCAVLLSYQLSYKSVPQASVKQRILDEAKPELGGTERGRQAGILNLMTEHGVTDFGSNHVLLGGMIPPASAMVIKVLCPSETSRRRRHNRHY